MYVHCIIIIFRETPLVHSSRKKQLSMMDTTASTQERSTFTPSKTSRETGKFKAYMEGFRKRMDKLKYDLRQLHLVAVIYRCFFSIDSPMAIDKDVVSIQTPYAIRIEQTPADAAAAKQTTTSDQTQSGLTTTSSILKSSNTRTKTIITSEVMTSTSRKIR